MYPASVLLDFECPSFLKMIPTSIQHLKDIMDFFMYFPALPACPSAPDQPRPPDTYIYIYIYTPIFLPTRFKLFQVRFHNELGSQTKAKHFWRVLLVRIRLQNKFLEKTSLTWILQLSNWSDVISKRPTPTNIYIFAYCSKHSVTCLDALSYICICMKRRPRERDT